MEDYRIVPKLRKGKVLVPSRFGCLQGIPTLNITSGCIFQCAYCYARGYSQAPKTGEVNLYVNLPALLEVELSRKKTVPPWVILNTSSDCFQTHPDILDVTFKVIQILLDHHDWNLFPDQRGHPSTIHSALRAMSGQSPRPDRASFPFRTVLEGIRTGDPLSRK